MPTVANLYHRPINHMNNIIEWMRNAGADHEANRLEQCSTTNEVYWDVTDHKAIVAPHRCNSRWCPICGKIRRSKLQSRIVHLVRKYGQEDLRFVTITQRDYPHETLLHAGDRLRKSLKELYRTGLWHDLVKDWYIRYEADYNPIRQSWHYHAHLLTHGRYMPVDKIRRVWQQITGDSYLIDVRRVRENSEMELAKYVSKLSNRGYVPLAELTDYCRHHRMFAFYGQFRSDAPPTGDPVEDHEVVYLGSVNQFVYTLDINILSHDYMVICQELFRQRDELQDLSAPLIDIIEDHMIAFGVAVFNKQTKS